MKERLQKILAQAGIASRRKCEELVAQGKVKVNGKVAKLGDQADSEKDKILLDNKPLLLQKKVYIMLNKPKGFVTTVSEQFGMKTVMELVKVPQRVFPVGRLDKDTDGLLLLTNDGDFANKLTHPSFEVKKEYFVVLDKPLSDDAKKQLQKGIVIDGRRVQLSRLYVKGKEVLLRIHEGRKHIVRRLFEKLGFRVTRLQRTKLAMLELGKLPIGKWRALIPTEVAGLLSSKLHEHTHTST